MFFHRINQPDLSINTYLLGDMQTKRCAVIDPTRLTDRIIEYTQANGLEISYILETHVHADFVSGSKELKHLLKGKPIIGCSKMGGLEWSPAYADLLISDGDEIDLGSIRLKARHTPGHTPEHLIWLCYDKSRSLDVPWFSFTGDLLFVGGIGRPDLLGKEKFIELSKQLYQSLFQRLADLPDSLEIFPAHGAGSLCGKSMSMRSSSTLGYERRFNLALKGMPEEIWIAKQQKEMPAPPAYFQRMKKINVQGPKLSSEIEKTPKELSWDELKEMLSSEIFLIDIREPETFARKHLKGSVNIPIGSTFGNWLGMVIRYDIPVVLILPKADMAKSLKELLWVMGIDDYVGYAIWNDRETDVEYQDFPVAAVNDLAEQIQRQGESLFILDVRTPSEWNSGHIEQAHHIQLAELPNLINQIPRDKPIATLCGGGFRASIAASLLQKEGFSHMENVKGGMQAWQKAGLPTIKEER